MPEITTTRRADRPTEGYRPAFLPAYPGRPVRLFLPADYQLKYAYPLVVLFHPDGSDEDSVARFAPQLSRRNYVAACPRGPVPLGPRETGRQAFAWGDATTDDYLLEAVDHVRREYHVHSDRVYLFGIGEGAAVACRLAFTMRDAAGLIALNGRLPKPPARSRVIDGLRVFIGHGANNPIVPVSAGRQAARQLESAGADVHFATYSTTHRVHPDMLREVNRWIMDGVNAEPDLLTPPLKG